MNRNESIFLSALGLTTSIYFFTRWNISVKDGIINISRGFKSYSAKIDPFEILENKGITVMDEPGYEKLFVSVGITHPDKITNRILINRATGEKIKSLPDYIYQT